MDPRSLFQTTLQMAFFLAIAPGVLGTLRWIKARIQNRQGPRPWQPYFNLWKLFQRQVVVPDTTSWVFLAAPFIVFGCYALIGAMAPIIYLPSYEQILHEVSGPPLADFLVIVGLTSLARFATALAGMDTGSPFGGMGSSREMFMHVLTEPVFLMVAYGLALTAYTTSLPGVMNAQPGSFLEADPHLILIILILLALALIMLAEAGRIPFDNPSTHLELTMIGKAVHLEYGGFLLGLLEWAEAMRLTFFLTLLVNLLLPNLLVSAGTGWLNTIFLVLIYPIKITIVLVFLAFWEETQAKLRLRGVIAPTGLALIFSMIAIIIVFVWHYL
jgi:formate hydrogenlyase subunit 4